MGGTKLGDAATVDTSGPLRVMHLDDGWYAVGKGMLIQCRDRAEAEAIVEDMTTNGTQNG